MCQNISIEEGLVFLTLALDTLIFKARPIWPREDVILAIKMLLRFKIFQFGYTYYRKKEGEKWEAHSDAYGKF